MVLVSMSMTSTKITDDLGHSHQRQLQEYCLPDSCYSTLYLPYSMELISFVSDLNCYGH